MSVARRVAAGVKFDARVTVGGVAHCPVVRFDPRVTVGGATLSFVVRFDPRVTVGIPPAGSIPFSQPIRACAAARAAVPLA